MAPLVLVRATTAAWRQAVAEPGALAVVAVFYLMVTGVLSGLWSTAARANGGEIVGYSAVALVWYVATTESAVTSIPVRMIEDIGDAIASRRIELEMLRPASVLAIRVATELGAVLPRLAVSSGLGFAFAWITAGAPLSWPGLALTAPALVLAVLVNIVIQHAFAAGAFWISEAKSAWFLYQKLVFIVGGMLLPLEVLPHRLEVAAKFSPFAAVAYVPGRLASGHVEPLWLVAQLGWLLGAGAVAIGIFLAGERRLVGAPR